MAVGIKFLPPSRTAIAAHFGLANFPVAYCGLKIITSLALRFPDFQRWLYINAEDPEVIVRDRIFAIGKKLNQQAKESIAKNLFIEPMLG